MIECIKNETCDTGFCDDGTCAVPGLVKPCKEGKCTGDLVCHEQSKVCVFGSSTAKPAGTCEYSSDCPPEKYCSNSRCVTRDQPGAKCEFWSCVDGYECDRDHTCRLKCDLRAKDGGKFDCPSGEECVKASSLHVGHCQPIKKADEPASSKPVEPIEPTEPIEPIKPIGPRRDVFSTSGMSYNSAFVILGIAGLVFVAFIVVVIAVACVKSRRRQKPDQTSGFVSPHAPSPTYSMQPAGMPMTTPTMAPMSPGAPPPMYSSEKQSSPRYY